MPLILLAAMMILLWVAGGASREDALGQAIVRAGAWLVIAVAIVVGPKPVFRDLEPALLLLAVITAIPIIQLIPLPPAVWQALPGRDILILQGEAAPWRPITMTPGATRNALASLVVPAAMLLLLAQTSERDRQWLAPGLLVVIASAVFLGLLQFSGFRFNNPLINDVPGSVSSIFANRNHFALIVAIGCLLAPIWAFGHREGLRWRGPIAGSLVLLFVLTTLAIGSRSGLLLTALALVIAAVAVRGRLKRRLSHAPRWLLMAIIGAGVALVSGFIWASFAADRVEAVDRLFAAAITDDLRTRAQPAIMAMIANYFPIGSGLGGFDPLFRMHEPDSLLALQYLNQAHNDFLGIALDAGLVGLLVLAGAVSWWGFATVRAWRAPSGPLSELARLGSAILLLIMVASITDYPARTPFVMGIIMLSVVWLTAGIRKDSSGRSTLPAAQADL